MFVVIVEYIASYGLKTFVMGPFGTYEDMLEWINYDEKLHPHYTYKMRFMSAPSRKDYNGTV